MHSEQVIWSGTYAHHGRVLGASYLVLPEHSVESDCLVLYGSGYLVALLWPLRILRLLVIWCRYPWCLLVLVVGILGTWCKLSGAAGAHRVLATLHH